MLSIGDIINRSYLSVGPEVNLKKAIEILVQSTESALMVVGADGQLVGMLDESKLLAAGFDGQSRFDPVSLHADRGFVAISPTDSLEIAAELMILHQNRIVPVVDGSGHLLGTVSCRDVLRALYGSKAEFESII